jgi:hypothetical protein
MSEVGGSDSLSNLPSNRSFPCGLMGEVERIPMSHVTILNRSQLFAAAATAISAVGFLTVSPPAQAHPMLPLAPGCSQYGFPGNFSLRQSNGDVVRFNSTGPVARGPATATGGSNGPLHGSVSGGIQGNNVDFHIRWSANSVGHYMGYVGNDGFAQGDTNDEKGPASASWHSQVPLVCSTAAAP